MSEQAPLQGAPYQDMLDKWQAHWPEWAVAEVFIPAPQRELARAWLALRGEWADAAWAGEDPTPGLAKLAWWQEELQGWARGAYRHPLGRLLQKQPVAWAALAAALPQLAASRSQQGDLGSAVRALEGVAQGLAALAAGLFGVAPAEAQDVAVTLLAERALRLPPSGVQGALSANGLLALPRMADASRPERIHAALLRGRLQLRAQGRSGAVPHWRALWACWRAARG
jgi:hypothetical protein